MKILFVGQFMSFLVFILGKPESCDEIDDSRYEYAWVLKIQSTLTLKVLSVGLYLTPDNVLSAFSPFAIVARQEKLVSYYKMFTYRRLSNIYCYRKRNPVDFIPPSEWPHTDIKNVPDVAIWHMEELGALLNEPALYHVATPRDTVEAIKSTTLKLTVGMKCFIYNFANNSDATEGNTFGISFVLQDAATCEQAFCRESICNVTNQYKYCAVIVNERDIQPTWLVGNPFFCNNILSGVMGRTGRGPETKKLFLLGGVQSALEVYSKWLIKSSRTMPTRGSRLPWTGPTETTQIENSTNAENGTKRISTTTRLTSRVNTPIIVSFMTKSSSFNTEVPKRVKLSGNALIVHPALYVILVIAFYERFT